MKLVKSASKALLVGSELAEFNRDEVVVVPGKAKGTYLCVAISDPDVTDDNPKLAHVSAQNAPFLATFGEDGRLEYCSPEFLAEAEA